LFKSRDPIGARLLGASPSLERRTGERPNEFEVVGVVRMASETNSLEYPSELPPVFIPYRRQREGRILIRTTGPAEPLIPTVTAIVRENARMIPVRKMQTLAQGDRLRRTSRLEAFGTVAGCGLIALALASVGLYAMVSVAVGQRRREIGIRAALGARAGQVVTMFCASGVRVTLVGLVLGLPLSVVGLALLKRQGDLADVNVAGVAALVTLAVVIVASLASWWPARRAARVHPMTALRSE
jgi:predicted lysophospholipase L1 biosynthesis ABC-type transport system permease subunit